MFDSQRDIILFLNWCRISNLKILNLISENLLYKFLDINTKNISYMSILSENEKEKISYGLKKFKIDKIKYDLYSLGIKYVTILDSNYPNLLKNIYDAPAILYYKGKDIESLNNSISIVGTRKPSEYGLFATKKIVDGFKNYDVSIVSGMALGIDAKAHNLAIENNLLTIGVLASSLEIIYPKSNIELYKKMNNHILISEFPLGTSPIKRNFIFRNRVISGLSYATIVVEAMEESGSLITAKYATEQNRDVFAVPGNINSLNSKGTNSLIKRGAKPISEALDIINEFDFIKETTNLELRDFELNDNKMIKIIDILKNEILSINQIYQKTNIPINELYSIILKLEFDGYIVNVKDNLYTIN